MVECYRRMYTFHMNTVKVEESRYTNIRGLGRDMMPLTKPFTKWVLKSFSCGLGWDSGIGVLTVIFMSFPLDFAGFHFLHMFFLCLHTFSSGPFLSVYWNNFRLGFKDA